MTDALGKTSTVPVSTDLRLEMTNGDFGLRDLGLRSLAALGDPTRRMIFEKIAVQPATVGELARGLPVSRSAVSQHLRVLKLANLVIDHPDGTRRVYRLDPRGISALRAWLETATGRAALP